MKFSKDGKFVTTWGQAGLQPGEFNTPHGIGIDSRGRLAGLTKGKDEQRFPNLPTGVYVGSAKDGSVRSFIPDEFLGPEDITVDARGDLYVGEARPRRSGSLCLTRRV